MVPVALLAWGGCMPEPWVLSPYDWVDVPAADDPWPSHRPTVVQCPAAARRVELDAYEVETGVCSYVAVAQRREAPARGHVRGLLWHEGLDAPEAAEAHVALLGDGDVIWEAWVAIPDAPRLYELDVAVPGAVAEIQLHLHNHGFNTWNLADVEVARE